MLKIGIFKWSIGGIGFILLSNSIFKTTFSNWPLLFVAYTASWIVGVTFAFIPGGIGVKEATITFFLQLIMPTGIAIIIAFVSTGCNKTQFF